MAGLFTTCETRASSSLTYWSLQPSHPYHVQHGPRRPVRYHLDSKLIGTFAHNPTVIWSEADRLYLLYYIGFPFAAPDACQAANFTCGPGNVKGSWDSDTTNPRSPTTLTSTSPTGLRQSSTGGSSPSFSSARTGK